MTQRSRRMWCGETILQLFACWVVLTFLAFAQPARTPANVIEQGEFRLHKFEQAIGEETYSIQRENASLVLTSNFQFKDRNTPVPLTATLKLSEDLTPQQFDVKGKNSRL